MTAVSTDEKRISELLTRAVAHVFPSAEEAARRLKAGTPLTFYYGIDPTGSEIHLGHTVQLLFLERLVKLGHRVIVLIGDFTARIGDPTGKDASRKPLTEEDIRKNMATYWQQIGKILDPAAVEQRHNSEWYSKMGLAGFITDLASKATVQQMLTRDMFQRRMAEGKPISVHELLYPLLQGYDSVALNVDGEIGGNDQVFNMLVGRDLLRIHQNKDKIVIGTKLLEDPVSGKKMSKSEGSYIALTDTPTDMFGKIMALPDSLILPLFECATRIPFEDVKEKGRRLGKGENPKILKEELAREIVEMYHGAEQAAAAGEEFEKVFSDKQVPTDIPEISLGGSMNILDALTKGFPLSRTEAKRLISEGAVKVNTETVTEWDRQLKVGEVIKVGAHRFLRIQ